MSERSGGRAELAAFLRARRAGLRPSDVGLPAGSGRRRTAGLRREEVAQLSGVGVTWYTWLEQARDISASEQVIDALARALLLSRDERAHIRQLAGLPTLPAEAQTEMPRLQRLVDALAPNVASICDAHLDYVVWNEPYVRVRLDPASLPASRRNMVWMMFTDADNRRRMPGWRQAARAVLSQFRVAAGQRPDDPRFAELVTALTAASPEFAAWWPEYPVSYFRPATIAVDQSDAGRVFLEIFQLRLVEQPDLVLVLQVPANRSPSSA